jgi:ribosomal protein L11 methyltransferase
MPTMTADVVLANILAGPLSELAPQLASLCRPGGWVVLSGLLVEQVDLLQNRYAEWFDMQPPVIDGDWARLTGRRLAVVP